MGELADQAEVLARGFPVNSGTAPISTPPPHLAPLVSKRQTPGGGKTEADLVTRARAGDPDAFAELVAGHRRELELHCYRILGSVQDAEDAVQETFLAAWQHIAGFEVRSSVRTWLYRIATNRCLDALRSARRRQPSQVTAVPAGPRSGPNATSD